MASTAADGSTRRAATLTRTERGLARLADEARWTEAGRARAIAVDILRLPGIYGPGRNALDKLRRGEARRIVKAKPCRQPRPCRRHRRSRAAGSRAGPRRADLERRRRRARAAAGRDRLCGRASRRPAAARGTVRDRGAFADSRELLRRGEARLERQGQGVARLYARLSDLSRGAEGAVRGRGGADAADRTPAPEKRGELPNAAAAGKLRSTPRRAHALRAARHGGGYVRQTDIRRWRFAAGLGLSLAGCYEPTAYGTGPYYGGVAPAPVMAAPITAGSRSAARSTPAAIRRLRRLRGLRRLWRLRLPHRLRRGLLRPPIRLRLPRRLPRRRLRARLSRRSVSRRPPRRRLPAAASGTATGARRCGHGFGGSSALPPPTANRGRSSARSSTCGHAPRSRPPYSRRSPGGRTAAARR